ncbi:hypothetical protein BDK51DRAFT_41977 [Blyttiomyces helicus]|uniref:Uncharacterized protein n=1 Tax=Blyttiomyces helicus TaxID=388810 RepID=A0A4P9WGW9_9FUNG|nr:hypothetical protein BDK51DRAFT_41977 [Blyttiomyces helicus]|eukprot:RKO92061.1 hypothetical protein BDK51DRAFT_41977 [Blyttiomyces helicus]
MRNPFARKTPALKLHTQTLPRQNSALAASPDSRQTLTPPVSPSPPALSPAAELLSPSSPPSDLSSDDDCNDDDRHDSHPAPVAPARTLRGRARNQVNPVVLAQISTVKLDSERHSPSYNLGRLVLIQNLVNDVYTTWNDLTAAAKAVSPRDAGLEAEGGAGRAPGKSRVATVVKSAGKDGANTSEGELETVEEDEEEPAEKAQEDEGAGPDAQQPDGAIPASESAPPPSPTDSSASTEASDALSESAEVDLPAITLLTGIGQGRVIVAERGSLPRRPKLEMLVDEEDSRASGDSGYSSDEDADQASPSISSATTSLSTLAASSLGAQSAGRDAKRDEPTRLMVSKEGNGRRLPTALNPAVSDDDDEVPLGQLAGTGPALPVHPVRVAAPARRLRHSRSLPNLVGAPEVGKVTSKATPETTTPVAARVRGIESLGRSRTLVEEIDVRRKERTGSDGSRADDLPPPRKAEDASSPPPWAASIPARSKIVYEAPSASSLAPPPVSTPKPEPAPASVSLSIPAPSVIPKSPPPSVQTSSLAPVSISSQSPSEKPSTTAVIPPITSSNPTHSTESESSPSRPKPRKAEPLLMPSTRPRQAVSAPAAEPEASPSRPRKRVSLEVLKKIFTRKPKTSHPPVSFPGRGSGSPPTRKPAPAPNSAPVSSSPPSSSSSHTRSSSLPRLSPSLRPSTESSWSLDRPKSATSSSSCSSLADSLISLEAPVVGPSFEAEFLTEMVSRIDGGELLAGSHLIQGSNALEASFNLDWSISL